MDNVRDPVFFDIFPDDRFIGRIVTDIIQNNVDQAKTGASGMAAGRDSRQNPQASRPPF